MSHTLLDVITACASNDVNMMKQATTALESMRTQPTFLIELLKIIANSAPNADLIRLHSSIIFKNEIRKYWDLPDGQGGFNAEVKTFVRENIISVHVNCDRKAQRQMLEAIYLISLNDFPSNWETMLSELQAKLATAAPAGRAVIVEIMDQIMNRYQAVAEVSDDVLAELKFTVLPALFSSQSSLNIVSLANDSVGALVNSGPSLSVDDCKMVCEVLRACINIMTSILHIDIAEQIEDALPNLVPLFCKVLYLPTTHNAALAPKRGGFEPGLLDEVQTTIMAFFTILTNRFHEVFGKFVGEASGASFQSIRRVGESETGDVLVATGVSFLSSVGNASWGASDPFSIANGTGTIVALVENVIIPNVLLRQCDEELFEERPAEYISRDLDNADQDTRRRAGLDLIRSLSKDSQRRKAVTDILIGKISAMMNAPESDVKNREGAICLVGALAALVESRVYGVTEMNPDIPFTEILRSVVLPVLGNPAVYANQDKPLLSCAALKFVSTYRNQLTDGELLQVVDVIGQHLACKSAPVRSYAAFALEKILYATKRHQSEMAGGNAATAASASLTDARLRSLPIIEKLFPLVPMIIKACMETGGELPQDPEVMKLLWRTLVIVGVVGFAPENAASASAIHSKLQTLTEDTLKSLVQIAQQVVQFSKSLGTSPRYQHFTFEALVVAVGILAKIFNSGASGPAVEASVAAITNGLFPTLTQILTAGTSGESAVADFVPYALQVMQAVLSVIPHNSSPATQQLMQHLLVQFVQFFPSLVSNAAMWQSAGKATASGLGSLTITYIERASVDSQFSDLTVSKIGDLLQRAKFCMLTRGLEAFGFGIINAILKNLPSPLWAPTYLTPLTKELLNRLLQAKNSTEIKARVFVSFSTLVANFNIHTAAQGNTPSQILCSGAKVLADQLEGIKAGLAADVFAKMWLKTVGVIQSKGERKVCVAALIAAASDPRFYNLNTAAKDTLVTLAEKITQLLRLTTDRVNSEAVISSLSSGTDQVDLLSAAEAYTGSEFAPVSTTAKQAVAGSNSEFESSFNRLVSADANASKRDLAPRISPADVLTLLRNPESSVVRTLQTLSNGTVPMDETQKGNVTMLCGLF